MPSLQAARSLLGVRLVHHTAAGRRSGRIVEVEAYIGTEDQASHARFGRTNRNAVMFGPAGRAYVYLVYGMYDCLNVVTETAGHPAALLIRAVEPVDGTDQMRDARLARALRRAGATAATAERIRRLPVHALATGPGLVTAALGIDRSDNERDLCDPQSPLRLEVRPANERAPLVVATPRIGIGYAAEPWRSHAWRFIDASSPTVSGRDTAGGC